MKSSKFAHRLFVGCLLSILVSCATAANDDGEDYFPVMQNSKLGFIDKNGKIVISPQFDGALTADNRTFREGLAAVKVGDKWGYIDNAGKFVIQPRFMQGHPPSLFHEGFAQVDISEGGFGFIDRSGEFVKALSFIKEYTRFSEGLVKVSKDDKFGYVDKTGKFVIEARFTAAEDFKEGLAAVKTAVKVEDTFVSKFGYIDKTGKMVIEPQFRQAESFSEGLAAIDFGDKYGYINKSGRVIIPPQFDRAYPFSEGLAKIAIGEKAGYIDATGKMVINPQFDYTGIGDNASLRGFKEGLSAEELDHKVGYIDKTGKMVIAPQYDYASAFHSGLAEVVIGSTAATQKRYYIDKTGKTIWERKAN